MAWINHAGEKYKLHHWKLQCLNCHDVVQTWNGNCLCGLVLVKEGRRSWPYFPVHDVSIWMSPSGAVLPQSVVDHFFNLRREPDKTGTDTETSTSTS